MSRITRHQMFLGMARVVSMRSTCFRLNVGCVITQDNRVVSMGYNGAPAGEAHCAGNECPGRYQCTRSIHAEANALDRLVIDMTKDQAFDLYTTHSPCWNCCKKIEWAPIRRVFFETPFRDTDHLDRFKGQWEMYQVTPAGYVVEWFSRDVVEIA